MAAVISIKNLTVVKDGKDILRDISLQLTPGRIIGLLGPSGAGKTTLIRTIAGRQKITSGSVEVLDQPAGAAALRKDIGYMTQGVAIYPDLTVAENLRYFAVMTDAPKGRIGEVLAEVHLQSKAKQLVSTLSGGEQSRLSLASALLNKAPFLALDEPTVGVDPVLRQQLWELFGELARAGTTLLISSHVMDEAERCDELLLIRNGQLLAQDTPAELRRRTGSKTVEESFLKLVGQS
ncbi:MAG TPA: ABC transporter ATP-binding protein [Candidatus Limnocylindria bacterium]|nr:ABC transporter ATP-binding protein [Candidatus Limnocylindria bacterium]